MNLRGKAIGPFVPFKQNGISHSSIAPVNFHFKGWLVTFFIFILCKF